MKKGLIVYDYDGELECWRFFLLCDDKVLFNGRVYRGQDRRDDERVAVDYCGGSNEGNCYREHVAHFDFDEFWRDCMKHNKALMKSIVKEAFPDIEITTILEL